MPLATMSAPTFEDGTVALVCSNFEKSSTEGYVRPLGTYFDIRDEVFDTFISMFEKKPIWSVDDLLSSNKLKYAPEVVQYLLQNAIHTHLKLKDSKGRIGTLENREGMYAFSPTDNLQDHTMFERTTQPARAQRAIMELESEEEEKEEPEEEEETKEEEKEPAKKGLSPLLS